MIFHELLHILLTDNYKAWPTNMISSVKTDDRTIQSHLHLMSLQRAVYSSLNDKETISLVTDWYKRIGGAYNKTWELISDSNKYNEFIEEFRDPSQWQVQQ